MSFVDSWSPILCDPFFVSCELMEFDEMGHSREDCPGLPVILLILCALRLECEE